MTKFLDMFTPIQKGNFGLTDEAIYKTIKLEGQFIPVFGGAQEHNTEDRFVSEFGKTKYDKPISVFNGDGIIISLDGSSGCMTYIESKKFALNHHAGFFQVKQQAKQTIIPEFFSLFFEKQLQEASIGEGSKTLTLSAIENMDFEIPKYDIQTDIMLKIKPLLKVKKVIGDLCTKINSIKERTLLIDYQTYQEKRVTVSNILDCYGGNNGLTEEEIYHNILLEGTRYEVLSSSTKTETRLGMITRYSLSGKQLEVFEDKEGILVIRNGKAGTTYFLDKGKYTITDHAYILALKDDCNYDISLKWFMNQYRQEFFEYVSSSDNATWNMSGFFKNVIIDVPSYKEQLEIVKKYDYLDSLQTKIMNTLVNIDRLFNREIVA